MRPKGTWKSKERELAALFGAERRALSGGNSKSGGNDDADHPRVYLECKYSHEHYVWRLWTEARRNAGRELRTPKRRVCIGLYQKRQPGALLVVHESDLLAVAVELLSELIKAPGYPFSRAESDILIRKFRVLANLHNTPLPLGD